MFPWEKELYYYFKKTFDLLHQRANHYMQKYDLTAAQAAALGYLYSRQGETVTQRDMERFFNIKHSTAIGIVQRLEQKGFVEIAVNAVDRRQRDVLLTAKGRLLEKECWMLHQQLNDKICEKMSEEQIEQFLNMLKLVFETLSVPSDDLGDAPPGKRMVVCSGINSAAGGSFTAE